MNDKSKMHFSIFYCAAIIILLLFRFPTIFYYYVDWDEASLMSEAWAMTKGQILYKDIYHIHPIFQFFIFIPFFKSLPNHFVPFAIKTFNIILILIGGILIQKLTKKITRDSLTSFLSASFFISYLSYFKWTHSSHGEFYILIPILLAANIIISKTKSGKGSLILAGMLCGIAFFIKQVAIFDTLALAIYSLTFNKNDQKIKTILYLIFGFIISTTMAFIYPIIHNTLLQSIQSMFIHNIKAYTTTGVSADSHIHLHIASLSLKTIYLFKVFYKTVINSKPMILYASIVTIFSLIFIPVNILKSKDKYPLKILLFCVIWLFIIIFGFSLIGRLYSHYFIQAVIPFSLIAALLIYNMPKYLKYLCLYIFIIFMTYYGLHNFNTEIKKGLFPTKQVQKSLKVAQFIRNYSSKNDTIFLFKVPDVNIFYLSKRLSCNGIYMFSDMDSSHTGDLSAEQDHKEMIINNLPRIMITGPMPTNTNSTLPLFFTKLLRQHYKLDKKIYDLNIYVLKRKNIPNEIN